MYCRNCGSEMPEGARVCQSCGVTQGATKYCQHCGSVIDAECVVCPKCGKQVSDLRQNPYQQPYQQPNIIINNANNMNTANAYGFYGQPKDKWVAVLLCFFFGVVGAHKFYEGKVGMGLVYICTGGLCGIGALFDLIVLLGKPNPYFI